MPDLLDATVLFQEHAFENALPTPDVIDTARRTNITIQVRQFDQFLGLYDDDGSPLKQPFGVTWPVTSADTLDRRSSRTKTNLSQSAGRTSYPSLAIFFRSTRRSIWRTQQADPCTPALSRS